jgi:pimeloyl-ACP methyl ester carboxylesterase
MTSPPVNHLMLSVNGLRLHCLEQGTGTPILLLHGFPEYSGAWRGVMGILSKGFRTLALDTRGIYPSEGPSSASGYSIDQLAADIHEAMEEAIARFGTPEMCKTDQGSQPGTDFISLLKSHAI